ncbi:MAG: prepilin-type N-terminal cleavage/methylation domain-containing protein [Desulfobacterales bacterium]|nr:prepilin-type N-terminal cleavage/methylation domain-containing protein [Desulfobacterales bacterium]
MKNNKNKQGFTLIEVMVAIVIFLIVMAASYTIFDAQQRSYIAQRDVASMQQNLRTGMYMIGRDIKMANCYLGDLGVKYDDSKDSGAEGYIKGITAWDNYNNEGSDIIDIAYTSFTVKTTIASEMPNASAELKVGPDSMPGWDCTEKDCCASADSDGKYQECFKDNDLVIISDGINSNLMTVGNVQSCNPKGICGINHPPSLAFNDPKNESWPDDGYGTGSKITKLKSISYRIDRTDPDHPQLSFCNLVMPDSDPDTRTLKDSDGNVVKDSDGNDASCYQPIAENIEDLQIKYIMKNGDIFTEIDDFDGPAPDNADPDQNFPDVKAVRVSIVARSDRPFSYYTGKRPELENNAGGTADHYMRRVYTAEFEARNLGLNTGS